MRAQTTLDFAVGVSIFLFAVAAVFLFIPETLNLFTQGGQAEIVTSNRVATSLSEGLLGAPELPYVLNTTCAVAFFGGNSAPDGCHYTGSNLTERVGVNPNQHVNITLKRNLSEGSDGSDILCWDGDDDNERLVGRDHGDCDTEFRVGDAAPKRFGTTVSSRRVVELNGTDVTLTVEMW